jgi:hypothetical protein
MQSINPSFPLFVDAAQCCCRSIGEISSGKLPQFLKLPSYTFSDEKCEVTTEGESSSLPGIQVATKWSWIRMTVIYLGTVGSLSQRQVIRKND